MNSKAGGSVGAPAPAPAPGGGLALPMNLELNQGKRTVAKKSVDGNNKILALSRSRCALSQ